MKRVLLFGGTFDPPHVGHLTMAQLALEQTQADEVWFLPAPLPPHKLSIPTYNHRLKMTQALIEGYAGMKVSVMEEDLPKPSYSVHTVEACQVRYPTYDFRFLLGADSLRALPTWHRASDLATMLPFVVAHRSTHPLDAAIDEIRRRLPGIQFEVLEMPLLDVSSTWLRSRLSLSLSVCGLVPERVLELWNRPSSLEP